MAYFKVGNVLSDTDVEKLKKKELILVVKELSEDLQVEGIPNQCEGCGFTGTDRM